MKRKDHDTVVTEHYTSPKKEHVTGKNRSKYKKHYRLNPRILFKSVRRIFGY